VTGKVRLAGIGASDFSTTGTRPQVRLDTTSAAPTMLRVAIARGTRCAEQGIARSARFQWQPRQLQQPLRVSRKHLTSKRPFTHTVQRTLADARSPDKTILPGSQSESVAGVPQPPILQSHTTNPASPQTTEIPPVAIPKLPPTPEQTSNLPPPKRPRRRFRNFLFSLIVLSTLGYAGGVYYSLVNDNFHDFFTEYIPYGEDAVAYFEEREFRKRFPTKEYNAKNWPQTRGENKVTIGRASGLSPRVAEEAKESDLGQRGRHLSAIEDNNKPEPSTAQQSPGAASQREKTQAVEGAKKEVKTEPKIDVPVVDHLSLPQNTDPVVQDLVKMVNNIITAVNASPEAAKLSSTVQTMKGDMTTIVSSMASLKDQISQEAETKIKGAHADFDNAAKELVRRLEAEMREQESKWREEYETERERLSAAYQARLAAELEAANKVADERNKNALLQQEIALQKRHMATVKSQVEEERSGRLAKLDELSSSVAELEKLTGEWNDVVDSTLRTQHLQVALEAVRAKILDSELPTPFLNELVALKEVSKEDDVVNAAVASINPVAYQRGIPSPASLIDRFRRVATEVRKASLLPEDAGIASHAASAVLSRFMFQKKSDRGLPEGEDVEAIIARAEMLLEEGDLDAAAREMNGLRGWAGVLSRDWVGECRRVLEVRQAVEVSSGMSAHVRCAVC